MTCETDNQSTVMAVNHPTWCKQT